MRAALMAVLRRDLVLAVRQSGGVGTAFGFLLTVIVLLPLGLGPDQQLLARIAPGALWIALLLSVLLSAERLYQADLEDGSLEVMAISRTPLEVVCLAKAAAHWLTSALPLAVAAPLLGFLLGLESGLVLPLMLAMSVGSLGLSLLASLGSAVTVGLRSGGLLVSLLILPLYVPILIFGVLSSSASPAGPDASLNAGLILAALVLVSLAIAPFAAAAALRGHMR